jgi:hypothetical protein
MRKLAIPGDGDPEPVDLCDSCGGVLIDFFDGEPSALSRQITEHIERFEDSMLPASGACPDCTRPMTEHAYLGNGPVLARCDSCMALFATPTQIRALAEFFPGAAPPAHAAEPNWLTRLVRALLP